MLDPEDFDLGPQVASPDKLALLREYAREGQSLARSIETMTADLDAATKALNVLKTVKLPDLMREMGSTKHEFDGWSLELTDFVSGSLPKDDAKRIAALEWLSDNGGDGLITTDLSLTFGKNQHNEALALADDLRNAGHEVEVKSGVHAQTLMAFGRELLRNGKDFEPETIGLYVGKMVKLKKVKE